MKTLWWYKYKKFIYSGKKEEAKELLLKKIPEGTVIYKYCRGTNRAWRTAITPKIWLCQAGKFNDPFDCAFLYNCRSKEIYDRETEYQLAVKENLEQFEQDKKSKSFQEKIFVSCFSEKCDSMLMWSHYGDEHKGICFGYDLHTLIRKYDFFPVIYSKKMPQESELDLHNGNGLLKSILTKSIDWSYEQEWRIVNIDESISGEAGKLIDFEKPIEIYIGTRQQKCININHEKYKIEKSINPEQSPNEIFQSDDFYVDINQIIYYKKRKI